MRASLWSQAHARTQALSRAWLGTTKSEATRFCSALFLFAWVATAGNCPRPGGVGSRGCPRHGCRGQAPKVK